MTAPTLDADPACPGADRATDTNTPTGRRLRAERRAFDAISQQEWDALAARNPWATPFSAWAFQRAWWDAYGENAHDQTLVVRDERDTTVAIVPLMHRHEIEPSDAATHTTLRHGTDAPLTPVPAESVAIFFGASYHADYATILTDPADLPAVADAVAHYVQALDPADWDALDLRRLRCGDPTADALATALGAREIAAGWTLGLEREDVCPVVTLPDGGTMDDYLATLDKKERHEIRRKVRRALDAGPITLTDSTDPAADLDVFIDLHQRRWGADGLFPATPGGDQSRRFVRGLCDRFGPNGPLRLTFLRVGGRCIASGVHFETPSGYLYYNAGIDPEARELSPGIVMVHAFVERAIERGVRRLDFLRGDEPYKYAWGAVDEPIQRLLVRRAVGGTAR